MCDGRGVLDLMQSNALLLSRRNPVYQSLKMLMNVGSLLIAVKIIFLRAVLSYKISAMINYVLLYSAQNVLHVFFYIIF